MAMADPVTTILQASESFTGPRSVGQLDVQVGGVDPLGLRQTNFDMMDKLLPGLNNVARHIRPFVVMCWARWKASTLVTAVGESEEVLNDFVDRIEALYVWSQVLCEVSTSLPGSSLVYAQVVDGVRTFAGNSWEDFKSRHKTSTSLSAALNYGPGLRNLGWVVAIDGASSFLMPTEISMEAVMALDEVLGDLRTHDALSKLGPVTVDIEFATRLGECWSIAKLTDVERRVAAKLVGEAPLRRPIFELLASIAFKTDGNEPKAIDVRRDASDTRNASDQSKHAEVLRNWRTLQTRQLFRLTLEALFSWTLQQLKNGPQSSAQLAERFVEAVKFESASTSDWFFRPPDNFSENPVDFIELIDSAFLSKDQAEVARAIHLGLRHCLVEAQTSNLVKEQKDRLPIEVAKQFVTARSTRPLFVCVKEIIEHWIFALHSFWCTGRGLADARAGGKTLLRLRVALEEDGWCLLPNAAIATPSATPDRLETALSLMREWTAKS